MHPRKSDEYAGTSLHLQYSLPLFKSLESKLLGQYPYWQLYSRIRKWCCLNDAGIAESVASSALRQALNTQDDVLGPWVPGRDPLEDALAAYAGTALPSWQPCAMSQAASCESPIATSSFCARCENQ